MGKNMDMSDFGIHLNFYSCDLDAAEGKSQCPPHQSAHLETYRNSAASAANVLVPDTTAQLQKSC